MLSSASSEPDDAGDGTDNVGLPPAPSRYPQNHQPAELAAAAQDYEYRNDAEAEGEYSASEEEGDAGVARAWSALRLSS